MTSTSNLTLSLPPETIYRIATLAVPDAAQEEFFKRANAMRVILRQQKGLLGEQVFEQQAGPGRFNVVTVAAWADQASLDAAEAAIAAANAASGFDRAAFTAANGIGAEIATFRQSDL